MQTDSTKVTYRVNNVNCHETDYTVQPPKVLLGDCEPQPVRPGEAPPSPHPPPLPGELQVPVGVGAEPAPLSGELQVPVGAEPAEEPEPAPQRGLVLPPHAPLDEGEPPH